MTRPAIPTVRRRLLMAIGVLAVVGIVGTTQGPTPAQAQFVDPPLADAAQEARARALHKQLRCLVCQNQSIDDSNADLARDLRILVRQRIAAGDSDAQAIAFIVERYGDWVLLKPPFKTGTLVLWLGPAVLLLLGAGIVVRYLRRRRADGTPEPIPLTADERRRLEDLLDGDSGQSRA